MGTRTEDSQSEAESIETAVAEDHWESLEVVGHALQPDLAGFAVAVFNAAAFHLDLVRAHRGVADEDHILGLYGMALRFASWGFRTVMIGARTPPSAVARIVGTLAPDVVALSATDRESTRLLLKKIAEPTPNPLADPTRQPYGA